MSLGTGFSTLGFFCATKTANLSVAQELSRPSLTFGRPTVIGTMDEGKTTVSRSGTIGSSLLSLGFCGSRKIATYIFYHLQEACWLAEISNQNTMSANFCQPLFFLESSIKTPTIKAIAESTWATLMVPIVAVSIRKNSIVNRPIEYKIK